MSRFWLVKILLIPASLLYGLGIALRNIFYRFGLLKSVEFSVPVISVGNLSVGGTGKTPHIEYLVWSLKPFLQIATLSRGYGRKTKGYREVRFYDKARDVGDEPLQFKRRFRDLIVAVSESRTFGIIQLLNEYPQLQTILLDDAFQHRSVDPGLNILLTEYDKPYTRDFMMPSGRLREFKSAANRADIIIVTKCPKEFSEDDRNAMIRELSPKAHQQVFFSYYEYGRPYSIEGAKPLDLEGDEHMLMVSAIANTDYLMKHLDQFPNPVRSLSYTDHHNFTVENISHIVRVYQNMSEGKKVLLTTEKDAMRLEPHYPFFRQNGIPLYVLPVRVRFHGDDQKDFDQRVQNFLLSFKV